MIEKLKAFLAMNQIQFKNPLENPNILTFTINNLHYLAEYNKDQDSTFFRMLLPDIDNLGENQEEKLSIARRLTSQYKCGKIIVLSDSLWISVETFLFGNVDAPNLFSQMILVLRDMIKEYRTEITQVLKSK